MFVIEVAREEEEQEARIDANFNHLNNYHISSLAQVISTAGIAIFLDWNVLLKHTNKHKIM